MLHVVSSVQRQPPIWWCHQLVAHPSETVCLPWQVHERGTVYRQLSAQPPHRLLPLKKNLNDFCLDCHSVCDNVYCLLTMFSALAAVCTVYCAIEIVLITLHDSRSTVTVYSARPHLVSIALCRTTATVTGYCVWCSVVKYPHTRSKRKANRRCNLQTTLQQLLIAKPYIC